MKIIFQTANLNHHLYRKLINFIFRAELPQKDKARFLSENKNYQVIIRPSTMASQDPFFHGREGVGGVTDPQKMVLYLIDTDENPKDIVQRVLRTNANVISHESGHALLIWAGMNQKVPLRHDDFSGHKAGTMLAFHTAEVHDRDTENMSFNLMFDILLWKHLKIFRYTVKILDFRNILA